MGYLYRSRRENDDWFRITEPGEPIAPNPSPGESVCVDCWRIVKNGTAQAIYNTCGPCAAAFRGRVAPLIAAACSDIAELCDRAFRRTGSEKTEPC